MQLIDSIYTTFLMGGQWVNWNSFFPQKSLQNHLASDISISLTCHTHYNISFPNAVRHCLWWDQIIMCSMSSSRYDRCPDLYPWYGKSEQNSRTESILVYWVMITIGSFLGIHASFYHDIHKQFVMIIITSHIESCKYDWCEVYPIWFIDITPPNDL